MKLQGSKRVKIQCIDWDEVRKAQCNEVSEPFRIWLYEEEGESLFNLNENNLPQGWQIEDEAELDGDLTCGYCPKHRRIV